MSASDIFLVGSSGLRAYQTQLATISQNIANVGSANYTRRTTTISESVVSGSSNILYKQYANFGGANATGVSRASDEYLEARVRTTGADLSYAKSYLNWVTNIESALNDDETGVGTMLTQFYSSVDQLAANPADSSLRMSMLYRLEQVVSSFRTSSTDLESALDETYGSAESDLGLLNNALSSLQDINKSLSLAANNSANKAQLLDNRDALLKDISSKLNVSISFSNSGAATVTYDSQTIASSTTSATFSVTQNADKTMTLMLDGSAVATPTNGTLGGDFAGSATARERLDALDALAVQLATDLNGWHQQGYTDGGTTNIDLLSVGTTAASLSVSITSISDIAVASGDGTINGNLVNIGNVREASDIESRWTQLITTQGNLVSTINDKMTLAENRDEIARNAREEVSGVNLDVEAADLLRVQQAYQACARVVQAAKDIIDSILNLN
ncbi:MAG: flagellar hook-associated protein FlgK [Sphingobium sp.]